MTSNIERKDNRITVTGELFDFHRLLANIHTIIEKLSYREVIIDLGRCTSAYPNSMLSVCAQVMAYRNSGISFDLIPPADHLFLNLFRNTNWAHFLDPHKFDPSTFKGHSRVPATQYQNPSEQQAAVNRIVNVMLGAIPEIERSDFSALEWSINELTDNVLIHSESSIGGLVQVSTFIKYRKRVQFVVADAGIGIPKSLKGGHPDISSDTDALDKAIREGVTRDPSIGQGNGMFGSYEICSKSKGDFLVDSGYARLKYDPNKGLSIFDQNIPYSGTLIVATVDFSDPGLLEQALCFNGVKHKPLDYVETKYEKNERGDIYFKLTEECNSFGSRVSGKPVRQKIQNLLRMSGESTVVIDFDHLPVLSSSFADEAFGKLFLSIGPIKFMQRLKLINMRDTVEGLINKAIAQRMKVGISDADT
ncbi:STAS-like domain-containing protein [Ralstonia pseudosolanacearum]|uniref:STAS-like domain-containing protein n=1 Tax=Ralstonia pseudosolanacearum TaxID=1310165 RepID=UPI0026766697|nr:STAS-like domain-containing protein [Ralstonia pseudosolanacearum]MDO3619793.1 STAS-like domain-containing protein [Ralstonia pseudosolanacearum]